MENLKASKGNKLVTIAIQQIDTASKFQKKRMEEIAANEEYYYIKKRKSLRGGFVINLPVMSGFIDTLLSKIDDAPVVEFGYTDLADYKRAKKVTSAWKIDSSVNKGNWGLKDRTEKKLALFSGRGISKYFAESDPKYKSNLEVIDHNNFLCEPKGGSELENHEFMGQTDIWKTKHELKNGEDYDQNQVNKLFSAVNDENHKKNQDLYKTSGDRFAGLGLNAEDHTYVGVPTFRLIEWYMTFEGKRYYLLFDYETGVWVKAAELKEVFEGDKWPFVSWATNPDSAIFWSKAPADDARPLCELMDILFTQVINNREKINAGMRGYDMSMIPDPTQLEYRPDGIIEFRPQEGKSIQQGVYEFKTEGIDGTIDLISLIDNFLGRKTGVTSDIQGAADDDMKVGVYFGNLQQIADRLGLYNKSYKEAWAQKGERYWQGLQEHLNEAMAIKMLGSRGIEWDELTKEDLRPITEFDIMVKGGSSEEKLNEVQSAKKKEAIANIQNNPNLAGAVNPNWLTKEILSNGGYDEADIKMATDTENEGNIELFSEAEQSIQDILQGREPAINRGANTAFIKYIIDYATDNINFAKKEGEKKTKQKKEWYDQMMAYARAHVKIAGENMMREAKMQALLQPREEELQPETPQGLNTPRAIAPGGDINLQEKPAI